MSRRRKLEKFEAVMDFPHVYELTEPNSPLLQKSRTETVELQGKWNDEVFHNHNDICLELACGRGEYTVALAATHPDTNYIGVDIKGARIYQGASKAIDQGLTNVAFVRTRIEYLSGYFAQGEINEIWITFPDPFVNKENRRMTSPRFLDQYARLLRPNGLLHFKTDDDDLFEYSLEVMSRHEGFDLKYVNRDIYASPLLIPQLEIKTYYEKKHLTNKKTIKYLLLTKNDRNLQH